MTGRDTFFRIISPEHLYAGALLFTVLTALVVSTIYLFLYLKKKRYRVRALLNDTIDDWITDVIDEGVSSAENIPESLNRYLSKKEFRQFIIDKLITIKKNISGQPAADIESIYTKLGLKDDSVAKMRSLRWYLKARGIYELYMMNARDKTNEISSFTNHSNKFVRREAQSALVSFYGFEGLYFLDDLTQPLLEWQHLKLLTQLQGFDMSPLPKLSLWLQSENPYVVLFALKLVEIYMQYEVHDEVVKKLSADDVNIRYHAIKALGAISNDDTASILISRFNEDATANKVEILKQLSIAGNSDNNSFLLRLLDTNNNTIKLEAIRTLMMLNGSNYVVSTESLREDDIIKSMSLQVKKELVWR